MANYLITHYHADRSPSEKVERHEKFERQDKNDKQEKHDRNERTPVSSNRS
jgi:hypothetical protein